MPLGGADNFVHLLFCHLAAHRYVVLPWWFQPTETQTGPLTQDDALINPPTAIDGSGRVIEPVEVAATAVFERGVTEHRKNGSPHEVTVPAVVLTTLGM